MKNILLFVFLVVTLIVYNPKHSKADLTAMTLSGFCKGEEKNLNYLGCAAYIKGFREGLDAASIITIANFTNIPDQKLHNYTVLCVKNKITDEELILTFNDYIKYIKVNKPEKLNQLAAVILLEIWPKISSACAQSQMMNVKEYKAINSKLSKESKKLKIK